MILYLISPVLGIATIAAGIVYWPYTGFEISAIPADETKDHKAVSKSLISVMSIVMTFICRNRPEATLTLTKTKLGVTLRDEKLASLQQKMRTQENTT